MKVNLFVAVLATLFVLSKANYVSYSESQVLMCSPETQEQVEELRKLESETGPLAGLDFWTPVTRANNTVHIMVGPNHIETLQDWLEDHGICYSVMISDVGRQIRRTMPPPMHARLQSNASLREILSATNFFRDFQRYEMIEAKLRSLQELDPRVLIDTIGQSSEGRQLYLVKVSNDHQAKKPVVFIDAGHHAREWISHSTGMYLLESLVNIDIPKMRDSDCKVETCKGAVKRKIKLDLEKFDYWFVPVANPDGYEYSHTTNRLWRKTRSRTSFPFCRGVDLNRNYDHHWNEIGASNDRCSEIYAGSHQLSEPESRAITSALTNNANQIVMYISLHAFSQVILTPFGYARSYPKDYRDMAKVASAGIEKMAMLRNTDYDMGPSSIVLYPASGGSDDFAYGKLNIKYSYTVELPDKGHNGFLLPPSDIIPVGNEIVHTVRAMTDAMARIENL